MTEEEIREAIRVQIQPTISAWAKARGLSPSYVSDVISGARPPSKRMLEAAGLGHLERMVTYQERGV